MNEALVYVRPFKWKLLSSTFMSGTVHYAIQCSSSVYVSVDETLGVIIQMKTIEIYFRVVLFIML